MAGTDSLNTPPAAKALQCLSCGAPLTLHVPGESVYIVCPSCHATNDIADPNVQFIPQKGSNKKYKPDLALGDRGILQGDKYEVIGFMVRCDGTGQYYWREYLLFNPKCGFRWLMEMDGHWTFMRTIKDRPLDSFGGHFTNKDRTYKNFIRGKAKVVYVVGEFYWRVLLGDTTNVADYISPPYILSKESDASEVIWTFGEYIPVRDIITAFPSAKNLPPKIGVAPNQPFLSGDTYARIMQFYLAFLVVLSFLHISQKIVGEEKDQRIYTHQFQFDENNPDKILTSPAIEIPINIANLAIDSAANVSNDWIYLNMSLVNDSTGDVYRTGREISYYTGYDSDGAWSEGGTRDKVLLSSVKGGTYHFVLEPELPASKKQAHIAISITRNVDYNGNFGAAFLMISFLPGLLFSYKYRFEAKRWQNSDYS